VVTLINQRSGERGTIRFREAGFIIPPAMNQINWLLRDTRANQPGAIDPSLIIFLDDLTGALGLPGDIPILIKSGYRSPITNANLRRKSPQVAENSYHLKGMAIDFAIPGVSGRTVYNMAVRLRRGGAAYYESSDHVHIDTGPVRTWRAY
jgi:uncharacterized protein YcbK (DUF882 family)